MANCKNQYFCLYYFCVYPIFIMFKIDMKIMMIIVYNY